MGLLAPKKSTIAAALAFVLSCFLLTLLFWTQFGGSFPFQAQGWRFNALFEGAQTLVPNADVRISGVSVGRVIEVRPRGERTEAEIEIDDRYAPIPSDTRAILRFKTLLGETFVALTPGSPTAPDLPEGGMLPFDQVEPTQGLDDVLSAFDEQRRQSFKRFTLDLAAALRGRTEDLSATLGAAAPATEDLRRLVDVLDRQDAAVAELIRDAGTALRAAGSRQADLQTLVVAGNDVLSATAERNAELTETVEELPGFLADLRRTLVHVGATTDAAAPTLRTLRPVAPLVPPGLRAASALAPQLERLFVELRPVIRTGVAAVDDLEALADAIVPLTEVLVLAGRELVPVVELLTVLRRELVLGLTALGTATQASTPTPDGPARHYLRLMTLFVNEANIGFAERVPSNRHNPYWAPGGLAEVGSLKAWDCANVDNPPSLPALGSAPPCLVQDPWEFRGATRAYPHVEAVSPES